LLYFTYVPTNPSEQICTNFGIGVRIADLVTCQISWQLVSRVDSVGVSKIGIPLDACCN